MKIMTQEDKELLIKDISARLPYGVKVQIDLQSNIYPPMTCKVCNIEFAEMGGHLLEWRYYQIHIVNIENFYANLIFSHFQV